MILLLNIDVSGVDDLFADTPRSMSPVYAILPDWSGFPRRPLLQIAIIGHIYHLDLSTRGLSISWVLAGCGDYGLPSYPGHFQWPVPYYLLSSGPSGGCIFR